ncbi:hypothetical protein BMETH_1954_0 [methanotrophic bacterial endosymbiont of Bathymodiolus sp.]|nr:hypothetical protein BMETH_1954_0 [methanotrophic bacterial endosymbiont of Bathymodiolus sp.]
MPFVGRPITDLNDKWSDRGSREYSPNMKNQHKMTRSYFI